MSAPEIGVVIPTFRRVDLLPRLVAALEAQTLDPSRFEVVLVDDASGDDTIRTIGELAERSCIHLSGLRMNQNGGPAAARNLGWRSTTAPIVAFTDDDCVPEPRWLEVGLQQMLLQAEVGILQGRTLKPTEPYEETAWTVSRQIFEASAWFEGCNLFLRREALEAVGGFDDSIRLPWGEDTELGWSVLDAGFGRAYDQDAIVRHDLAERGLSWHLKMGYREGHLVRVAHNHPRLRTEGFWRPWAVHPTSVIFAIGIGGTILAPRWRGALLLWLPWLWHRRPARFPFHPYPRRLAERWLVDAVTFVGMKVASVKHRRFVL